MAPAIGARPTALVIALAATVPGCESPPTDEIANSIATEQAVPAMDLDAAMLAALPPGITRDVLDEGRRLFAGCSVCHGEDGRGTQLGPPLRGPNRLHVSGGLEEIEAVIRSGVESPARYPVPMPGTGDELDDGAVRALAAYVLLLGQEDR